MMLVSYLEYGFSLLPQQIVICTWNIFFTQERQKMSILLYQWFGPSKKIAASIAAMQTAFTLPEP
jgi:hypothetical protein